MGNGEATIETVSRSTMSIHKVFATMLSERQEGA